MTVVTSAAILWLASLFSYSGALKAVDLPESRMSVRRYRWVGGHTADAIGTTLPLFELLAAGLLISPSTRRIGGALAVLLGLLFMAVTLRALVLRIDASCGCVGHASGRVSSLAFGRTWLIVAAGVAVSIDARPQALPSLAVVVAFVIGLCPGGAMGIARLRGIRARAKARAGGISTPLEEVRA